MNHNLEGLQYLKKEFRDNMLNSDDNSRYGSLFLEFHLHRIHDDGYDSNDQDCDTIHLNKKGYDIFENHIDNSGIDTSIEKGVEYDVVDFEFLETVINTNLGRSSCCNGKHINTIDLQKGKIKRLITN